MRVGVLNRTCYSVYGLAAAVGLWNLPALDKNRGRGICRGAILELAAGALAFAHVQGRALAATGPTGLDSFENRLSPPLVDPGAEPARPAAPAARARPQTGNPLWAVPLKALSVTRERPIFSPSRRPPPPAVVAAPYVPTVKPPPPKPAEPDHPLLTLLGTVTGETEGIGIFVDQATSSIVRLKTGQDHAGWRLLSIRGREANFEKDNRSATLLLPPPGAAAQAAGSLPAAVTEAARSGDTWMDGDGQMISPPVAKRPPTLAVPTPVAAVPAGADGWMGPQK